MRALAFAPTTPTMASPPPTPCFANTEAFYRYSVRAAPGLTLSRSALISALHKLDRRDRPAARKALVYAFFSAVARVVPAPAKAAPTPTVPKELSGAITNFLNRFAVALFEEGSFLHLNDDARRLVVRHLIDAQRRRARCHWGRTIADLSACIDLTAGVPRGRLISLARCQVLFQPDDGTVPERVRTLFQQLESRFGGSSLKAAEKEELRELVRRRMKAALPLLTECDAYGNCKEVARVLWMSAAIAPLVTDEVRSWGPGLAGPMEGAYPSLAELQEIGVFDLHVTGKSAESHEEFLTKGSRVANPTPLRLFGRAYADLDAAYVKSKRERFAAEQAAAASASGAGGKAPRKRKGAGAAKAAKAAAAPYARPSKAAAKPLPPWRREAGPDAFDLIEPVSGLLGFKNATVLGILKVDVGALKQGSKVFVKLGESEADGAFSAACYDRMRALEMPHVHVETTTVVYDPQKWHAHGTSDAFETPPKWLPSMLKHMKKYEHRAVPLQVASYFDGMRLTYVPSKHPEWLVGAGKTLFQAFFFAKWVGVKDLGPFNMMMNAGGEALLVDLNEAGDAQWPSYNAKGLQTAHKLKNTGAAGDHLARALRYAAAHEEEAAEFLERLVQTPAHPRLVSELFSEEARAALRAGWSAQGQPFWTACTKGVDGGRD